MKKISTVLWGVVLVACGVLWALKALDIINVNIFFNGWWTLFIIVPCAIGILSGKSVKGNAIGLAVGVLLLLCCRGIMSFDTLWKLAVPAIVIIIGLDMMLGGIFGAKGTRIIANVKENNTNYRAASAIFSGRNLNFGGEAFLGTELTAVFGGVKCDLRNAIITQDCAINVCAVFGGIDILVPENVKVKVNTTSIFGGVSNKAQTNADQAAFTLYINGICMFGGVDIK